MLELTLGFGSYRQLCWSFKLQNELILTSIGLLPFACKTGYFDLLTQIIQSRNAEVNDHTPNLMTHNRSHILLLLHY